MFAGAKSRPSSALRGTNVQATSRSISLNRESGIHLRLLERRTLLTLRRKLTQAFGCEAMPQGQMMLFPELDPSCVHTANFILSILAHCKPSAQRFSQSHCIADSLPGILSSTFLFATHREVPVLDVLTHLHLCLCTGCKKTMATIRKENKNEARQ